MAKGVLNKLLVNHELGEIRGGKRKPGEKNMGSRSKKDLKRGKKIPRITIQEKEQNLVGIDTGRGRVTA